MLACIFYYYACFTWCNYVQTLNGRRKYTKMFAVAIDRGIMDNIFVYHLDSEHLLPL